MTVEVLSPSNTKAEMQIKLGEYFQAGVRLVWIVDPKKKTVSVYTSPEEVTTLAEKQTLTGGEVLPGFELPLKTLFAGRRKKKGKP